MVRIIVASFAVVIALGWIGRMDEDVLVARSLKERLQFGLQIAHGLIVEGHLGIYEAERVRDFHVDAPVRELARSVGRLIAERDRFEVSCTATAIAADLILTNHHCVYEDGVLPRVATFQLDLLDDDAGPDYAVTLPPIEADRALDYAILKIVPGRHKLRAAALPRVTLRDAVPGEDLMILHHPQNMPLLATRAHCRADRAPADEHLVRHTCRTAGGSSGAILFAAGDHAIVGLHRGRTWMTGRDLGRATPAAALLAASPTLRRLAAEKR